MSESKLMSGRGLDVGTGFLCMSQMNEEGKIFTKSIRDSFLEIKPANKLVFQTMKRGLIKSGVNFIENEDRILILGQDSLNQSVERQAVLRRPMERGVISPTESQALPIFKALLRELLGNPAEKNEKIVFSIPAPPVDAAFDVIYHTSVIESILEELGYSGQPLNEGHAIAFSELEDSDYSGILMSFGSGMTNVAVTNMADLVSKFSVSKGGDYIDTQTAVSLGYDPSTSSNTITPNLVTFIKESGIDLMNVDKSDNIKRGISAHYRALIKYVIDNLVNEFTQLKSAPKFLHPIPVVLSGGTSLAGGFVELFKSELNKVKSQLPFTISEIRHSSKPLTAVAEGCMLALLAD